MANKNDYRECEMLKKVKAEKITVTERARRDVAIEEGYILPAVGKTVVLCGIKRGKCPYKFEGQRGKHVYEDTETGDACICTENGLIKKTLGLIEES